MIKEYQLNLDLKPIKQFVYDFKKSNELNNTKFASFAKKISKGNKLKINGLSTKTLTTIESE